MLQKPRQPTTTGHHHGGNYMSDSQLADYLTELRTNRAKRLNASLSGDKATTSPHQKSKTNDLEGQSPPMPPEPLRVRSPFPTKNGPERSRSISPSPSTMYLEDSNRWVDKQEARSLRLALQDMDLKEEYRIQGIAQEEATQLMDSHRAIARKPSHSAFANPDRVDYKQHLRNGSYGRSHGLSIADSETQARSTSPLPANIPVDDTKSGDDTADLAKTQRTTRISRKKSYQGLANAVAADNANIKRWLSSGGRRVLSGNKRRVSNEKHMFPAANDRIYEEPEIIREEEIEKEIATKEKSSAVAHEKEQSKPAETPKQVRKNPFARVRFDKDHLGRSNSAAPTPAAMCDPIDIQKNPPSQSRRPWYLSNKATSAPTSAPIVPQEKTTQHGDIETPRPMHETRQEIRSAEMKAATSMQRKERSAQLPQPTAVTKNPARPIVSFQDRWQEREVAREVQSDPRLDSKGMVDQRPPIPSKNPYRKPGKSYQR